MAQSVERWVHLLWHREVCDRWIRASWRVSQGGFHWIDAPRELSLGRSGSAASCPLCLLQVYVSLEYKKCNSQSGAVTA
jgi:hypothetical protein